MYRQTAKPTLHKPNKIVKHHCTLKPSADDKAYEWITHSKKALKWHSHMLFWNILAIP